MRLRKILSVVLMIALLGTIFPTVVALAEEASYTWEINDEGTLIITGTGAITGFNGNVYNRPWHSVRESITSVVINEGITSMDRSSFEDIPYLTRVSLPSTLKVIGWEAFIKCPLLDNVVLPEGLEEIGWSAFERCTSLTEITIPASVTTMGTEVFAECSALKKVTFNNTLTTLPGLIFDYCNTLEEVVLPNGLINTGSCCFRGCTNLEKIVLPDSLAQTGQSVFEGCTSLTEINTENIVQYGEWTFKGCSSLKTITINEVVKNISVGLFENSGITNLTLPENLHTIGTNAFANCTKLENVNIPENLQTLEGGAFSGCTSLTEFTMPKNITEVSLSFFKGCTALNKVTLHDNVTRIGEMAFEGCSSLASFTLPENIEELGYRAFSGTNITEITIPNSLDYINYGGSSPLNWYGPFGESNIETAYFEGGRTQIPDYLFTGATKLKNVDLSNIEKIGVGAFSGCSSFVPELTEATTEIGNYAFANCVLIEDFEIPAWMEKIPDGLFYGTGIGYLKFPATVKEIGANAYQNCKNLSYIEFPASVTDIGKYAFSGCTALDEIDIPGTVINIGQSAFEDCTNLAKLTMHKGTQTMGSGAFAHCSLTDIRPSQTIRELGDGAFWGNPVRILVVPRFCVSWDGWGNAYNDFNPTISFVSANVQNFDIYTYQDATIYGVEGTAGEAEVEAEREAGRNLGFVPIEGGINTLAFDEEAVDIVLDETYDAAAVLTIDSDETRLIWRDDIGTIVRDWGSVEIDNELITFASDNEEVATVDDTGYIHAISYGTANITVSCESGKTDTLTVNVVRPSIGVSLSSGYKTVYVGSGFRLSADTIPAGFNETYIWSSSDEEIATVDASGYVTAVKEGTAVITATGERVGKSASCVVTVTGRNPYEYEMGVDKFIIGCEVSLSEPENGGNVIGALYDRNDALLGVNVFPASENVKVDFAVPATEDLSDASIKVFWWNTELVKPVSRFKVIEIE